MGWVKVSSSIGLYLQNDVSSCAHHSSSRLYKYLLFAFVVWCARCFCSIYCSISNYSCMVLSLSSLQLTIHRIQQSCWYLFLAHTWEILLLCVRWGGLNRMATVTRSMQTCRSSDGSCSSPQSFVPLPLKLWPTFIRSHNDQPISSFRFV